MPNLIGYSKKDAVTILNLLGFNYEINGYGYVISQSVKEGSLVDDTIILTLNNKDYMMEIKEGEKST